MRRLLISCSLILLALAVPAPIFSQAPSDTADSSSAASDTADTSDLFLNAYMANEEGEKLENSGDTSKALEKYRYAASLLDQITRDDPKWQPIVVDYRKKRVSANILRLQGQPGSEPPTTEPVSSSTGPSSAPPEPTSVPLDGALPEKGNTPDLSDQPIPPVPANAPQEVRDQIQQLQNDLRDSRARLKTVESEKETLATRLDDAVKQLDQTKVSESELKGQLKQAQDAYQNSLTDKSQGAGAQKQYQDRIAQLEKLLQDAEADRDAADEQNADYARRATKAHQATAIIAQQRDAAVAQTKDLQSKFADASKLAAKLDAANKQITALTRSRSDATAHADDLEKQLASTSKTAAELAAAQKEIASLKATDAQAVAQAAAKNTEISSKLADARKQITQITSDRDAARKQIDSLDTKLSDAQTEIASVKSERDQIATQRDQALAELTKARAAEKRVNELIAANTTLTQKLADDDKLIKNFKSGSPEKDKQIADLRKEVSDTKALLATAQQDRDNVQSTLSDLQQQYDSATSELTELKANKAVGDSEKKTLTDENDLLRGIVLRELRGEAARDQAKRLVLSELSDLKVQSDTLLKRIDYLGEPVVQLTEKEKSLFKDPSIDIPDADNSGMDISISAPKQTAPAPIVDTVSSGTSANASAPATTPAPDTAQAPQTAPISNTTTVTPPSASTDPTDGYHHPVLNMLPAPAGAPTPTDLANFTAPATENALPPAPTTTAQKPDSLPSSPDNTASANAPAPMVPAELLDDAKSAKDSFERGQYRDAERTYEKMLTAAPNNVYILSNLGVVYFRNEKTKLAEESLNKAIAVAPEDTFSWCTLGIVYYQEKRYDDAINSLTRALAINPKYAVAHNYLGITASQKGWQEAALKELETAVELDPNYGDAYFNLAVVYAMQTPPNKNMARKYYKRAVDLGAEPDASLEQLVK